MFRFLKSPNHLFLLVIFCCLFSLYGAERNIIFFVTDDLSPTLGCYGDKIVVTPAID